MTAFADEVARAQIRDHTRRLNRHDDALDEVDHRITDVRVDVAKLLALGLVIASILSTTATALIVHYLTPARPAPPAVLHSR
jgi:hypothetical protein